MSNKKTYATALVSVLFLSLSYSPAWAQEEAAYHGGDDTAIVEASTVPQNRISNEFKTFLGTNAETVVSGLRTGNEIIIEETIVHEDGTTTIKTTSIDPPTGKMGYGNVKISLGLAREELAQWGIGQPTAEELKAALVGGEITAPSGGTVQLDGVLALRSGGMGWGQIAQEYGVKLGTIVSGMKSGKSYSGSPESAQANAVAGKSNAMQTRANHDAKASSGKAYGQGIVSGANETAQGRHTIKAQKQYKQTYQQTGIVTGSGAAVSGNPHSSTVSNAGNFGNGNAYGRGIVTAEGNSITATTSAANAAGAVGSGNSNGKGLAKGHYK